MGARQRILSAALLLCALACLVPACARASDTESSVMIDDNHLIYDSQSDVISTMQQMRNMGVDDVKVSVVWQLIAPNANSQTKPSFDDTNPAAYPNGAWARYDLIDREAAKLGMGVYFQLLGPAPVWARANLPNQGPDLGKDPTAQAWADFVEAVGKRYSGSFTPSSGSSEAARSPNLTAPAIATSEPAASATQTTTSPLSGVLGGLSGGSGSSGGTGSTGSAAAPTPLPRVTTWELWNEPNEHAWLNPWYRGKGKSRIYLQPTEYRTLVNQGYKELIATGHSGDTILIGETANQGVMDPVPFIRQLYCVGSGNLPLRGASASRVGCPSQGKPSAFVAANPGLFNATGFAHHPYSFDIAPNKRYPKSYYVTIYNINSLEKMLNQIYSAYGRSRSGGVPLYLTEFGYQSDPPDPFQKTTLGEQETYINEGEYMTWQDPYVRTLAQFELYDDNPRPNTTPGTGLYWSTFQTGLLYANGTQKPSYDAFLVPIWVPHPRHGKSVTVWGQLRPADHTTVQYGVLQFAAGSSTTYNTLAEVSTTSSEGFFVYHANIPSAGTVRIAFLDPYTGQVTYSRTVSIS